MPATSDNGGIVAGMTIKAQGVDGPWAMPVARRARDFVPAGVTVSVREDFMRETIEVWLREAWWRRGLRWLGMGDSRGRVLARVTSELAGAPAGWLIQVRWL